MGQGVIKILISDDNLDVCEMLCNFFKNTEGMKVCAVTNDGQAALNKIFDLKPDIVLLDLAMPNMDGIDVLKALNTSKEHTHSQVIMMSAIGQEDILKEAFSLGASYYLVKPFKLETLKSKICTVLKKVSPIETKSDQATESLDLKIAKQVIAVGVPTNVLGYKYIIDVLNIILNSTQHFLFSTIYSVVAEKNDTTVQCVESAIRNSIFQASKKNNATYNLLFSQESLSGDRKPTNSQFLTKLAESIKLGAF